MTPILIAFDNVVVNVRAVQGIVPAGEGSDLLLRGGHVVHVGLTPAEVIEDFRQLLAGIR